MPLLLLSRFSRVRLCATPQMAAHQAPPSLGFSRQEHWSGLPFPSPSLFIELLNSERNTYCGIDAVLKPTIKQTDLVYMLPSFHFTVQYSKGLAKQGLKLISHFLSYVF